MPIRPSQKHRYPPDWPKISRYVREVREVRAGDRCEGSPAYPDCRAENGQPHPMTGSRVVVTVAHLDHTLENCDLANLRAWCQRCHTTYDAKQHAQTRRREKIKQLEEDGQGSLRLEGEG